MNLVIDNAVEYSVKKDSRKPVGKHLNEEGYDYNIYLTTFACRSHFTKRRHDIHDTCNSSLIFCNFVPL